MAPAPETPQQGMSSRLLTMKFMQRAAASVSSTGTPSSDERSSKRRRVERSDATPSTARLIDQAAVQAALKDQEARRQSAFAKHNAELADTHWVLDGTIAALSSDAEQRPLKVEYVGYADIDASPGSDESDARRLNGRKTTENYKRPAKEARSVPDEAHVVVRYHKLTCDQDEKEQEKPDGNADEDDDSESSEAGAATSSAAITPTRDQSRPRSADGSARGKLKRRRSAEPLNGRDHRDKRRKEVNLNRLTSISSAGAASSGGGKTSASKLVCFTCNETGHIARDCPNSNGQKQKKKKHFNRT